MSIESKAPRSRGDGSGGGTQTAPIEKVTVSSFRVPTEKPESDGTFSWADTTMVLAQVEAAEQVGLGYTYGAQAAGALVHDHLAGVLTGRDAFDIPGAWVALAQATRNLGRSGVASHAISALDTALWDLKARVLGLPLAALLGRARSRVPVYGSGGFTSASTEELVDQLGGWISRGMRRVKMKVGRDPHSDVGRVRAARLEIGSHAELFVDANGAYSRKQALGLAGAFAEQGVTWFEEPVSSDDLEGLRLLRDRGPAGMDIAAGEYGYDPTYFRRMLAAGAVDVLQADATRCGGITGFLQVAALCEAEHLALSAHTAPMLHLPVCCAARPVVHLEYFHDHVRLEALLFDGVVSPVEGDLAPDLTRPGLGIELKRADAKRFMTAGEAR